MFVTSPHNCFFFIRIVEGAVQLGPFGTSATEWPNVPAPGDDGGEFGRMKVGRGNRSTRRKPAPAPLCPPQIPFDQTRDLTALSVPRLHGVECYNKR
jgi:hypothetical protein